MNQLSDYTLEEYRTLSAEYGVIDPFEQEWQYKLYLALMHGDDEELKKARNNYYWNCAFRMRCRFN